MRAQIGDELSELNVTALPPAAPTPSAVVIKIKRSTDRRIYATRQVKRYDNVSDPATLPIVAMADTLKGVDEGTIELIRIATESQLKAEAE